jgi:flagellar FliL protein
MPAAEQQAESTPETAPQKGGKKKLIMIIAIVAAVVIVGAGGYFGYTIFSGKAKAGGKDVQGEGKAGKSVLITADPFVVNLSDPGRYLKVSMQFEVDDPANQPLVTEKMPKLRDAIITLLSSKSSESVSGPEGKFQLKDEILLRANQAMGKDVIKNLYFTEFVMQ